MHGWCSPEYIKEKIQFAIQGQMDNSNFAIAIAVGLFGVLTLSLMIEQGIEQEKIGLFDLIAMITLSIAYWVLIAMGLVAHAHHRMYSALVEKYVRSHYVDYEQDLKDVVKGNRILNRTINSLWLNRQSETINKYYTFITTSFLAIAVFLFVGIGERFLSVAINILSVWLM